MLNLKIKAIQSNFKKLAMSFNKVCLAMFNLKTFNQKIQQKMSKLTRFIKKIGIRMNKYQFQMNLKKNDNLDLLIKTLYN